MDKHDYDMWTKLRAQGKLRYIIKTGILKFSLPLGIIVAAFISITYARGVFHILAFQYFIQSIVELFFIIILMGIPVGILYGLLSWWSKERKYQRYKKTNGL